MARPFRVQVLNQLSAHGLTRLPGDLYDGGKELAAPDARLVRSADMHALTCPTRGRRTPPAGAGTSNIAEDGAAAGGGPSAADGSATGVDVASTRGAVKHCSATYLGLGPGRAAPGEKKQKQSECKTPDAQNQETPNSSM